MALLDIEKRLMPPEMRSQYETGGALRSMKRSHGKYRYRHLKAPTSEQDISTEDMARIAFDYAEKTGGTSEEITGRAKSYYDLMVAEQQKRAGRQGRETLAAIKAGAAETPYTVMPTPEQAEAIPKGEWFLTEEQAKLKLAKSGAIPADHIRHFMMGQYTPESKALLEKTMAEPRVGPPEKFEGGETTGVGRAVGALFDILGTGGRAAASGKAAELKDLRESGRIEKMALGKETPFLAFGGLVETIKGMGKGAIKSEDAPNLEAEIVKTRDYLIELAFDEAEKELKGFSDKDITDMAKYKYNQYAKNLGIVGELALEHPSGVSTAYEIAADPLMYAGGAPYKLAGAAVSKAVPKAAKAGMAKAAAKVLRPVSYQAQFLPLEQVGEAGEKLARQIRFAETNLAPGVATKLNDVWEKTYKLAKRAKNEKERELLFEVIDGSKDISALPKHLAGVKEEAKRLADEAFEIRKQAGAGQRLIETEGGEMVTEAAKLEDYVPHAVQEPGIETLGRRRFAGPVAATAKKRTGEGAPVKDYGKQWEAWFEAEARTAPAATAYGTIKEASEDVGAWHVFRPSKDASLKETVEGAEIAFTEATKGRVPFMALDKKLTKNILQVTERPGTVIPKGTQMVVPEPVGKAIERIGKIHTTEQSFKAVGDLYKSTIRPLQNIWRVSATVLRSPAFLATNFVGAIGLGGLAHGLRAANLKLQGNAIRTAALAAFGGSSKALKTKVKLPNETKKRTLGELYNLMRDVGILGQYGKRYALDMPGTGPLGKAEQIYRKIPEKIGLQQLAGFGDEYQHAVAFLGALKSTSPDDVAKAADFTAKFAGNYNRLTHFEKTILKEISGFYTWNRFILPHVTKQIFENPQRLLVWEKLKKGWEEYYGRNRPVFEAGIPNWMKYQTAATAPESMQPEDPHEMAMTAIESPQNTLGAMVGEGAVPFMLGPGAAAAVELITGIDLKTGKKRPDIEPYMPNAIETKQGLINLAEKSLPYGEALANLGRLYWNSGQHGAAAETWLKYRVARDWLNIDRLVTGQKLLGIPGITKTYAFKPMKEAARKKRRALGD